RAWRRAADAGAAAAQRVRALATRAARRIATAARRALGFWAQRRVAKPALVYVLAAAVVLIIVGAAAWALAGRGAPAATAPSAHATPTTAPTVAPAPTATKPSPTPAPTPVDENAIYATIETEKANIRSGPATVYPIISVAEKGQRFQVIARSPKSDWFEICCIQGKSAWVYQDRVKIWGDMNALPISTPTPPPPQQIRTTSDGTGR
ncbi:MAG: SH3 domain-containing protein, partial [Chloroflexi bacterium]|nr:SH3 domain-containing protein [Chloroflexota bacterium]